MKFIYFGYDFMLPSIARLMDEGHELLAIQSFEVDNVFNFNQGCQAIAKQRDIPFVTTPADENTIQTHIDNGAELFLAAGYPTKIPPIEGPDIYAVNVHPTYLPCARGLMPIPGIITGHIEEAAGFTAHKMTEEFDAGDILLQRKFDLRENETVESYTSKIAMRAPDMFSELVNTLPALWQNATPQDQAKATTMPTPGEAERTLNWNKSVKSIDATTRAFGRFGCIARFDNNLWVVYHSDAWEEAHDLEPGTVAARLSREITIALKDGYICLKDLQLVTPQQNTV